MKFLQLITYILTLSSPVIAGPLSYGICQSGCNVLAVTCYAAAGATMGVTFGVSTPASVIACNAGLGLCMTSCIAAGCSPIP